MTDLAAPAPTTIDPRGAYRDALLELAEHDDRIVCVDTDTGGLERTFRERFPDRYVSVGIAEANMFSVAAGLAARGLVPYAHTMAAFASMRAAEQLKLDVVGSGLPIRVVATHGGLSAAHFGASHFALEDLAVVRALPGLTVVVPADGREIGPAVRALHDVPGPTYLRLGRSATPPVLPELPPFELGRVPVLREGGDVAIVAVGPWPTLLALEAADALSAQGIASHVAQVHTLTPLDTNAVLAAARAVKGVVTVEEHRPTGGLGDAVSAVLGAGWPLPHRRVAVEGAHSTTVRDHRSALAERGVSTEAVVAAALAVLRTVRPTPATSPRGPGRLTTSKG